MDFHEIHRASAGDITKKAMDSSIVASRLRRFWLGIGHRNRRVSVVLHVTYIKGHGHGFHSPFLGHARAQAKPPCQGGRRKENAVTAANVERVLHKCMPSTYIPVCCSLACMHGLCICICSIQLRYIG